MSGEDTKYVVKLFDADPVSIKESKKKGSKKPFEGSMKQNSKSSPAMMSVDEHSRLMADFNTEDNTWPVNVAFKNVTYKVKVPLLDPGINTVWKVLKGMANPCAKKDHKTKAILENLSGAFAAGTMTLVLGPRSAGVTTMFKALADSLIISKGAELTGDIKYSGYGKDEVMVRKFCTYVDEADIHIPTLTVQETMDFASTCFGSDKKVYGAPLEEFYPQSAGSNNLKTLLGNYVDFVLYQMGLANCRGTIIGDEILRGVSGGEKHRVTTAEMLVGRRPLMFFDQLSTGLDSAATFDIIRDLKSQTRNLNKTFVVSLLQPSPEVYDLFDEILVLADGMILFQGPRDSVLPFFASIGYNCPPEKDLADFIQEVTTDMRDRYTTNGKMDKLEVPRSNKDISNAWNKSKFSQSKKEEINRFMSTENRVDNKLISLIKPGSIKYSTDPMTDFKLVMVREAKLLYRNRPLLIARIFQSIFLGTVMGTVFYDLPSDLTDASAVQQRFALMFFLVMQASLAAFGLVPQVFQTRDVFYKQSNYYFHRVLTYAVSTCIVGIPIQIAETFVVSGLSFWLANVVPRDHEGVVASYFGIVLFLFLANNVLAGWFRFSACVSPNPELGTVVSGMTIAMMILFSGFIITPDNMPSWFVWIYWSSPLAYAVRSLGLIMFTSSGYSDAETAFALGLFQIEDDVSFIWYGFIFLVICVFTNMLLIAFALGFFRYDTTTARREIKEDLEHEMVKNKSKTQLFIGGIRKTISKTLNTTFIEPETLESIEGAPKSGTQVTEVGELLRATAFKPVSLVFKDLVYSVPSPNRGEPSKTLLNGISGYALPGTMTALMGSSGAGKTTLMDVIAGRKTAGSMEGNIYVNGVHKTKSFANLMGYVEQMDVHSPHQTIEEAIQFSARLRQRNSTVESRAEFTETVLATLQLTKIRDFAIGIRSEGGISAEQAKRVTIAVELAANPSILFLDEPTSGLDSRAADVVMRGIKRVSQSGRTIVCTIHQPNRAIFETFHRILLLKRGGYVVYFGDLGRHSEKLVDYLEAIPGTPRLPNQRYNPANYMLQVIGAGTTMGDNDTDFSEVYKDSELFNENEKEINGILADEALDAVLDDSTDIYESLTYTTSYATQQKVLLAKVFNTYWRNPTYVVTRHMMMIFLGIIWGSTYWQVADFKRDDFDQSTVVSIMGVVFSSMTFLGATSANLGVNPTFMEKAAFMRERYSKMYRAFPYALSLLLAEVPYLILACFNFALILLFMMGFDPSTETFFRYVLTFASYIFVLTYMSHMIVACMPNPSVVPVVIGLLMSLMAVFSGFLIAVEDVSPFWKFMTYIVPSRYALQSIAEVLMFCPCEVGAVLTGTCTHDVIGCALVETSVGGLTVNVTSWALLQGIYGFEGNTYNNDILALTLFSGTFLILSFVGYTFLAIPKR